MTTLLQSTKWGDVQFSRDVLFKFTLVVVTAAVLLTVEAIFFSGVSLMAGSEDGSSRYEGWVILISRGTLPWKLKMSIRAAMEVSLRRRLIPAAREGERAVIIFFVLEVTTGSREMLSSILSRGQ